MRTIPTRVSQQEVRRLRFDLHTREVKGGVVCNRVHALVVVADVPQGIIPRIRVCTRGLENEVPRYYCGMGFTAGHNEGRLLSTCTVCFICGR